MFLFLQKINMLESSGPSTSTMTTAQHQQMARQISSQADFAEEYFASLSAPAKRLIEVRTNFESTQNFSRETDARSRNAKIWQKSPAVNWYFQFWLFADQKCREINSC